MLIADQSSSWLRYVVPLLAHFADIQASIGFGQDAGRQPIRHGDGVLLHICPERNGRPHTVGYLLSLKATPTPPTADELDGYLTYLVDHKFYNLAYYAWLQFLLPGGAAARQLAL